MTCPASTKFNEAAAAKHSVFVRIVNPSELQESDVWLAKVYGDAVEVVVVVVVVVVVADADALCSASSSSVTFLPSTSRPLVQLQTPCTFSCCCASGGSLHKWFASPRL